MRKVINITEVIVDGDPDLAMLKPATAIDYTVEINPEEFDNKVTIATFHSYGTIDLMKRHVYLVKTRVIGYRIGDRPPRLRLSQPLCNIGLGAGLMSVSKKDSSLWALHGVVTWSPKCWEKRRKDKFVPIYALKWNWIMKNWG
jgi:hypothetical protein